MLCGISGPSFTGKTTLARLLAQSLPLDTIVIPDYHEVVYQDLVQSGIFSEFQEIHKDRDYLLIYISRVIAYYKEMIEAYRDYPGLVIFDGTHIDLLIYSMLQLWYHYPTQELQENLMHDLLKLKDEISIIYMTSADDASYPILQWTRRRYNTSFRKCRKTELYYYDIFRDLNHVVPLPSTSLPECEYFIREDLSSRGFI